MFKTPVFIKSLLTICLALSFLSPTLADDSAAQRDKIHAMRNEVLEKLYQQQPGTREEIRNAAGYAVFSNVGVNLLFFAAGGGNGIAHNNYNGQDSFMKMASAGVGLGVGIKDFRAVFVFHTAKAYRNFILYGWDFSGQADAAIKSPDKGEESSTAVTAIPGVSIYQLTEAGVALQATLQGSKYWHNTRLNSF